MDILFENAVIYGHPDCSCLAVSGERIAAITGSAPEGRFDRRIDCGEKLLFPGLYNTHCHAAMTLFRGYGEELPLDRWLNERIFPAEDRLTPAAVYNASMLACAEMIKNGVVSFSDMYFFCEETVKAAVGCGMKANISRCIVSFDPDADPSSDSRTAEAVSLFREYNGACGGRIMIDMSLHAEYTNTERMCRWLGEKAAELGAGMQIHLSETQKEHAEGIARRGKTPAGFFYDCGVFDVPTTAAHCVYVKEEDMALMAEKNVICAHNPVSNLKLGSGVAPVTKMADAGVRVSLGTDGAASNNTLDVMKEMYLAAILHKGVENKADILSADTVIAMATENGAAAQRRKDCGKLETGRKADIILIDTDSLNNIPSYSPAYTAVYSANSSDVRLTMIDGRIVYENGEFTCIDIEKVRSEMKETVAHYFD